MQLNVVPEDLKISNEFSKKAIIYKEKKIMLELLMTLFVALILYMVQNRA